MKAVGGDAMRGAWMEFSAKSQKFDDLEAHRKWESFRPDDEGPLTIGTLRHYAQRDDPEAYRRWKGSYGSNRAREAFEGRHPELEARLRSAIPTIPEGVDLEFKPLEKGVVEFRADGGAGQINKAKNAVYQQGRDAVRCPSLGDLQHQEHVL
jgi:hypothetical protein